MTNANQDHLPAKDSAGLRQFSLLRAKLVILAATAGHGAGAAETEIMAECETSPAVDVAQLAGLRAEMTGPCFANLLHCYLLDVEFYLEDIARARRANDFPMVARKAAILASAAAGVGALHTSAAAHRLDDSCRAGHYRQSGPLIRALSQSCTESEMELCGFLAAHTSRTAPV